MTAQAQLLVVDHAKEGFKAFDGSDKYFKRLKFNDLDCCFLEYPPLNLQRGRKDNPAISYPDDGYFILEKEIDCCCPTGRCVVVESVRWYGEVLPVGTIFPCPPTNRSFFLPRGYIPPPNPMPNEYVFDPTKVVRRDILASPLNTATFGVLGIDPNCCNEDGSKGFTELIDEIPRKSGLVIKNNALVAKLTPLTSRFAFTYTTTYGGLPVTISGVLIGTVEGNIINVTEVESLTFNGVVLDVAGAYLVTASSQFGFTTPYNGPVVSLDGSIMDMWIFSANGGDLITFGALDLQSFNDGNFIASWSLGSYWPAVPPDAVGEIVPFNRPGWSIAPLP